MCLGVPARVIQVIRNDSLGTIEGKVDFGGVLKEVDLSYTPEVAIGDYVVVHVGFAISVLDETEATKTLQYLEELSHQQEERVDDLLDPP